MGRRAVLPKSLPYLRRLTLPPPAPPTSPSTPSSARAGLRPSLSLSGKGEEQKRSCCSWAVQAQRPGLWYLGCQDEAKRSLTPPPNPGLGSCPGPSTIPCPAPARSPPNNNQRKRKRCHLPMPALRVSKPSGMGGARQLLGAWRGGGLPGGGHGTAYLEPPSLPEHAHRPPHPQPWGQLKLQGGEWGSREP